VVTTTTATTLANVGHRDNSITSLADGYESPSGDAAANSQNSAQSNYQRARVRKHQIAAAHLNPWPIVAQDCHDVQDSADINDGCKDTGYWIPAGLPRRLNRKFDPPSSRGRSNPSICLPGRVLI